MSAQDNYILVGKNIQYPPDEINAKQFVIRKWSGSRMDNFLVKLENNELRFGFFKLHATFFININAEHIFEYGAFTRIVNITQNNHEGKVQIIIRFSDGQLITLENCCLKVFEKSLQLMEQYIKNKKSILQYIYEYLNKH